MAKPYAGGVAPRRLAGARARSSFFLRIQVFTSELAAVLMEFLVEDAARTRAEVEAGGVSFLPGPIRKTSTAIYACTQPLHGLAVEYVQTL